MELELQYTNGGIYDSNPLHWGASEIFLAAQKVGGDFHSTTEWTEFAENRLNFGHGEAVSNMRAFLKFAFTHGFKVAQKAIVWKSA